MNKSMKKKFHHEPFIFNFILEFTSSTANMLPSTTRTAQSSTVSLVPSAFPPEKISVFLSSLQNLYNHACETFDVMPHQLQLVEFHYPSGELKFHGLKDPAHAIACALEVAPDVLADLAGAETQKDSALSKAVNNDHQHLDSLKKIISGLEKIKRKHWTSFIAYTLSSELGIQVNPSNHLKASWTNNPKPSKTQSTT